MHTAGGQETGQRKQVSRSVPHLKWTHEEDERLERLVAIEGTGDWMTVSKLMGDRNPRQCKERWGNYLRCDLKRVDWTPEEDELLVRKYEELGARWVHISKFFPNRTDSMVKTRFKLMKRREERRNQIMREPNPLLSFFAQSMMDVPHTHEVAALSDPDAFDTSAEISELCDWDVGCAGVASFRVFDII
jgi:hypothetical protein